MHPAKGQVTVTSMENHAFPLNALETALQTCSTNFHAMQRTVVYKFQYRTSGYDIARVNISQIDHLARKLGWTRMGREEEVHPVCAPRSRSPRSSRGIKELTPSTSKILGRSLAVRQYARKKSPAEHTSA